MGVARSGIFVLDDSQSTVHFLLLRLEGCRSSKHGSCREKCAAGVVYLLRCHGGFLGDRSGGRLAACVSDGTFPALVDTVHTCHATAVIYLVCLDVDARCLAVAGTKSATAALLCVNHRFQQGILREEAKHCTYRTDGVAIGTSAPPCQHDEDHQSDCGNQQGRETLHPYIRFIEGIAVSTFGQVSQSVVCPLVERGEKAGNDAPV